MAESGAVLLRGSLFRTALLLANIIVGFFLMPLVVHAVGDRWYGMWMLVGGLIGYFGYFDFGLSVAVQRFVAQAIAKGDKTEVNRLMSTALVLFVALGVLTVIASLVIAGFATHFLEDATEVNTFRTVIIILGLSMATSFAAAPANGLITANLRYDSVSVLEFVTLLVRTALIVYFMRAGYSIVALAVITFLVGITSNGAKVWLGYRIFPDARLSLSHYTPARVRGFFAYGARVFVNQVADVLRFEIDHLVIAAFVNLSAVTTFSIAGTLAYYFRRLIDALIGVLVPNFARQQANGDHEAIGASHLFATKLVCLISILGGGSMIIFGLPFIRIWMGPEYASAYPSLIVLAVATTFYVIQLPTLTAAYGLGAVGMIAKLSIAEAIGNLVLSLILVQRLGIFGVALGTAIPATLVALFLTRFGCRLVGTRISSYVRAIGPVLLLTIAMQVGTAFIVQELAPDSLLEIAAILALLYPPQAVLALWLVFTVDEQRVIRVTTARAIGLP